MFGNWLKTLTERDSRRLRRLESLVMELTDDVTKCLELADRINARLRQRARRASETASDDGSESSNGADDNRDGHVAALASISPVGQSGQQESTVDRIPMRDALRARARQRGLLPGKQA